jgi:ABC-type glycerol-3-phosphate transport system substrate-binding protein
LFSGSIFVLPTEVDMNKSMAHVMANRSTRRGVLGGAAKLGVGAGGASLLAGSQWRFNALAQDPTEISMMGWGSPLEKENVDKGLQVFEGENPDITVEWIHIPDAADQQVALKTAIAGGNAPDVFWSTPFRDFVAIGAWCAGLLPATSGNGT